MASDFPNRGPLRLHILPVELAPGEKPAFLVDALQTDPRDTVALTGRTFGELRRRCGEVLRSVPVDDAEIAENSGRWNYIIRSPGRSAQARVASSGAGTEGLASLVLLNNDWSEPWDLPEAQTVGLR